MTAKKIIQAKIFRKRWSTITIVKQIIATKIIQAKKSEEMEHNNNNEKIIEAEKI